MSIFRNQNGAALITALLVAALVTVVASALIFKQQLEIRRSGNIIHGDQATLYAKGMETWIATMLSRVQPGEEHKYLGQEIPPIMIEGGQASGSLRDMQGLFNLNNLVLGSEAAREKQRLIFRRLLTHCGMEPDLEQAVSDWLDSDQEARLPAGAEDGEYLRKSPSYRTADQPISEPGELAMIKGFVQPAYEQCLKPLLAALPEITAINVNSAPPLLLAALSDQLDLAAAEQIAADRPEQGYAGLDDFLAHPALAGSGLKADSGLLSGQTRYFVIKSEAVVGQSKVMLSTIIKRDGREIRVISSRSAP